MKDLGKNIAASLACVDHETRIFGRAWDHVYLYKAGDVGRFIADLVPPVDGGGTMDRTMEIHDMAVSPKGDYFAIGYGGKVDSEGQWRPCGPRSVDVFSMAAVLKWYDETVPKGQAGAGAAEEVVIPWQ